MIWITQVLCPVDLSECSRHAVDRAAALASCYGAKMAVLNVVPASSAVPAVPFGPEGPGALPLHAVDRGRLAADVQRFFGLEQRPGIDYHVVEAPLVHKEILLQAERLGADLIVMGTHGHSGLARFLLGSVAEKVLRTSLVPVMTVPPHVPDASTGGNPFRRILYATDFSGGSDAALAYAGSLAQHGAAQLTIVHVVEAFPVGQDPVVGAPFDVAAYHAELEKRALTKLQRLVPPTIRAACDVAEVLATGKPYVEILRIAAERQIDLIVLGVHGRNAVDRLVFGSTTEHILRRATCPILTVRAPDPAR